MNNFIATSSIIIDAPAAKVWDALTNPTMIKKYLFGTDVTTDWRVGSPITYKGEWKGTQYEDKGTILNIQENRLLETTYWSSMGGKEDKPENYNKVSYELEELDGATKLTITQDNIANEEAKNHSQSNWDMVLQSIKKLLEESDE